MMSLEDRQISEAEKMDNRRIVERKIRRSKEFFKSAIYKSIVWDEDDEVVGYEEDQFTS